MLIEKLFLSGIKETRETFRPGTAGVPSLQAPFDGFYKIFLPKEYGFGGEAPSEANLRITAERTSNQNLIEDLRSEQTSYRLQQLLAGQTLRLLALFR